MRILKHGLRPSKLDSLLEPIEKVIRPNQIYNDYKLPLGNAYESSMVCNENQKVRYVATHTRTISCSCECHKPNSVADNSFIKSHTKRAFLTPSPDKYKEKSAVSRKSSGNSISSPYKSFDSVPGQILPSLSRYRMPKKISNIRSYFRY